MAGFDSSCLLSSMGGYAAAGAVHVHWGAAGLPLLSLSVRRRIQVPPGGAHHPYGGPGGTFPCLLSHRGCGAGAACHMQEACCSGRCSVKFSNPSETPTI